MVHATFKIQPGVNHNRTPALNEAQLSESNLIRFINDNDGIGLVQKLGGWTKFYPGTMPTIVRALWAWEDTNAVKHLAVGCETASIQALEASANGKQAFIVYDGSVIFAPGDLVTVSGFVPDGYNGIHTVKGVQPGNIIVIDSTEQQDAIVLGTVSRGQSLYVITNNSQQDITPAYEISTLLPSCSTTAGSSVVKIKDPSVVIKTGDIVNIKTQISVGGLILFGTYLATNIDDQTFSIISRDVLNNPLQAKKTETDAGKLPEFLFSTGSPFVSVNLPNHGYSQGDTFSILVPVQAGAITLYGNYTVDLNNVADTINSFTIISSAKDVNVSLFCNPVMVESDGTNATFTTQVAFGVLVGDQVSITNCPEGYDGIYTVTAVADSYFSVATNLDWNVLDCTAIVHRYTGGTGTSYLMAYSGSYFQNIGDEVITTGFVPQTYNGTWKITAIGKSSITVATTATGDVTGPGTFLVRRVVMNGGNAEYQYFNSADVIFAPEGYGLGGYGRGGYGIGGPTKTPTKTSISVTAKDWTIDNWGQQLISCPVGGGLFMWDPTSGATTSSLIDNAPIANDGMFVAMPQRQIVCWGSTFNGVQDPLLIRWCDVNNYNVWAATVTNQAGSYRISKGSKIVGAIQGPQQGLVWTDLSLWSMQYSGPPYVYSFTELSTGCGLIARKAAGSLNGNIYWMSRSQFFVLDGSGVSPIPCPIWDVIFQDLDENNLDKIRFAANSDFNEVSWYYPTVSAGGEVSNYVKYNAQMKCWDYGTLDRTAWINQSVFGPPIGAATNNFIYQHETSYDQDGVLMPSYFRTGYAQINDAENLIFVDQVWPDFKWGPYEGEQSANLNITFFVCDYPGETPRVYGPMMMNKATKFLTPRFRGRLVSMQISEIGAPIVFDPGPIPQGKTEDIPIDPTIFIPFSTKNFWRIGALRYRASSDGKF